MPEYDENFSNKIARIFFDFYEHESKSRSEFVAKLDKEDWMLILGEIETEKIAEIIWECMDVTADTYFGDVE